MKLNAKILQQVIAQDYGLKAVTELKFHPKRKWRFDLAIPSLMLAIEFEGGRMDRGKAYKGKGVFGGYREIQRGRNPRLDGDALHPYGAYA